MSEQRGKGFGGKGFSLPRRKWPEYLSEEERRARLLRTKEDFTEEELREKLQILEEWARQRKERRGK
jgi:hypothetical protein